METENSNTSCKGKIFALKQGYNPNSSSVGSQIPLFFISSITAGTAGIIIMHLFAGVHKKLKTGNIKKKNVSHDKEK